MFSEHYTHQLSDVCSYGVHRRHDACVCFTGNRCAEVQTHHRLPGCSVRARSTRDIGTALDRATLGGPMIWDADFMLGPKAASGTDSYVLGEINVSSVFPMPDEAPEEIAGRVADRLRRKGKS